MQRISLPTVELAYIDRGAGQPVVLMHGFPLDHTMWNPQIDALADVARVIAPDLRGFGQSSLGNVSPTRAMALEQYADDVVALLDAINLKEPIILAGFSMGGYIVWQFVRKYADRLRALIQIDTRAAADTEEARANRLKMAAHIEEWGSARVAEMMGPKLFAAGKFEANVGIVKDLRRVIADTPPASIAVAQRAMAARPDMTHLLPQIKVPSLVVAGVDDALIPAHEMRQIAAAIPNGKYVEIPTAGHMSTIENPDAVNKALRDFVKSVSG
jgi:pimeloyl-ACP methyl ester carboxylesterase